MERHLHRETEKLKKHLLHLSAVVEENLQRAGRAIQARDIALAEEVIRTDREVDQLEVDFEEECLKVLALHQPVASDLRFIIAMLKINNDLERIDDLAVNLGKRARYIARHDLVGTPPELGEMVRKAQDMVHRVLDALINRDAALANAVCQGDDVVDELARRITDWAIQEIRKTPEQTETLLKFVAAARHLERVADHATNIAEDVIYMLQGDIIRHRGRLAAEP